MAAGALSGDEVPLKEIKVSMTVCFGSRTGEVIASRFKDTSEDITLVFSGITAMDVSFVVEAIIKPAQQMHAKGLLLCVHLCNLKPRIQMNIEAACVWSRWPVHVMAEQQDKTIHRYICGPTIPVGCYQAYTEVQLGAKTSGEVARILDINPSNASNKLTQLWRLGFLVRTERSAETGGIEYVYRA